MKILVVSNLYPPHYVGGYELRCQQTVNALRRRGHDVQVLTSNHGLLPATPLPAEDHIERTLHIHGFFGHPWLNIRDLSALESHNNARLRDAIQRVNPDVVHVWNLGGISKSFIFTLERLGIPTVYDVSDHWIARSLKADVWLDWWNRLTSSPVARALRTLWTLTGQRRRWDLAAPTDPVSAARFPRIYFCSAALRDLTAAAGFPVWHADVIHCPVDTERFNGQPQAAQKPMRKLLYVGRLAEDKGVMTALRAMLALRDRFPGALQIVGKGDPEYVAMLHSFVQQHGLPVMFSSATPEEMPEVYRHHDALLFTSEWAEPFALTPLEAMASGLPVIGTTTGGSRELLRHGENSLTYDAGNAEELAQRILELEANPQQRARLAITGHSEVRERCNETVIVNQIEAYLMDTVIRWPEFSREAGSTNSNETKHSSYCEKPVGG
jgi:glycosyltransferase involved in cell wall biosynthesis